MATVKRYYCIQPCTFRAPGTNYDRRYEVGATIVVPADWKGHELTDPKNGKKFFLGVPLKCFREYKGAPPSRPTPSEVQRSVDRDPMSAALSGEPTTLSEIAGQTEPDE